MTNSQPNSELSFSLEMLGNLDPLVPEQMAEFVLGTCIINTRELRRFSQNINVVDEPREVNRFENALAAGSAAIENLDTVTKLLNGRELEITALDPASEPIRHMGSRPVEKARGILNHSFVPEDKVRLYSDRTLEDYYDVQVVGDELQPLVQIVVLDSLKSKIAQGFKRPHRQ
jgi:hypothetical protein